ncbi:hypothetical protein AB4144_61825, partial [Rhizobiaceae sp. 2RAB30]
RYVEQFDLDRAVSEKVVRDALATISADLARLDERQAPDTLVGMGGAITNITAVSLGLAQYDPERIQGASLSSAEIERQVELYRSLGADARRSSVGLQP